MSDAAELTLASPRKDSLHAAEALAAARQGIADLREALCWAVDEIDALSNRLSDFGYPQGMALIGRQDQVENYFAAIRARRAALAAALAPADGDSRA